MNDCDWVAAESEREAIQLYALFVCDSVHEYMRDYYEKPRRLTKREMELTYFIKDSDEGLRCGEHLTFRQYLNEIIAEGTEFPTFFASTNC